MSFYIKSIFWLDAIQPPLEQHLDRLTGTIQDLLAAEQEPLGDQQPIEVEHLITEDQEPEYIDEPTQPTTKQVKILDGFAQSLLREAHVLKDQSDLLWQQLYNGSTHRWPTVLNWSGSSARQRT
jgi:hypothetical protein